MNDTRVKPPVHTGVGLLHKAFQILDLFQAEAPAWSQSELARMAGLPRSTASRLVRYLTERGYLMQLERSGRYLLGPAAMDLGRRAAESFDLGAICRPVLERIAEATSETVILTALDETRRAVACMDQIESTREGLRVFERIGALFPLHAGAAPKAVLAFLEHAEQERILKSPLAAKTARTITDPQRLREDLALTVARGYAVSFEETYTGVLGVAAPLFGASSTPIGSIAIAAPLHLSSEDRIAEYGAMLTSAASELNQLVRGGRPADRGRLP